MGVRGLTAYMNRNNMFQNHQLHDTVILIDGYNLVYKLYFHHQQQHRCDHMYGGDYPSWCHQIRSFFSSLRKCNVKPFIIFDGSFDPSLEKFDTQLERGRMGLNTAHRIYSNNFYIEGIIPLMAYNVFRLELELLDIAVYQTCYEADTILIRMAFDLQCPIMSNDSDFFLYNLPGGIISIASLDNFFVRNDDHNYIKCSIYKSQNLKRSLPDLNLDLVQIAGFLLGNDYVDLKIVNSLIPKITQFRDRQKIIRSVLAWISKHRTLEPLLYHLATLLKDDNHPLLAIIRKHFLHLETVENSEPTNPESYFKNIAENMFLKDLDLPEFYKESFLRRKLDSRILSISKVRVDWCRPCVEDFSFTQSCHETTMELHRYIYGLLRAQDTSVPKINRFSRVKTEFRGQGVSPFISLENEPLPKFAELSNLTGDEREKLFFRISQIDSHVLKWIKDQFQNRQEKNFSYTDNLVGPFCSMMFAMIFFLRTFPGPIWMEFLYAIYVNIWLCGYLCGSSSPTFLKLDSEQRKTFRIKLSHYSEVPKLTNTRVFMPRVVHFYNAYQAAVVNLTFLADILDVKNIFDPNMMLSALCGTFIYNLTVDLASRSKPLLYLELLVDRQEFKPLNLFKESLLGFIIDQGRRIFLSKDPEPDGDFRDILPGTIIDKMTETENQEPEENLVRAFDVTNKRTHIQSQKMKLKK